MLKRMLDPGLMVFTIVVAAFSFGMAQLLVQVFGWRYTDPLNIITNAFDPSMSILAFTMIGGVVWPILLGLAALISYDMYFAMTRNAKRIARRATRAN